MLSKLLAGRGLGCRSVRALAGTLNGTSLGTTAALVLRSGATTRQGCSTVHGGRASRGNAVLLTGLGDPHHWGESLILRDLHCRTAVRSLETSLVGNLVVSLNGICIDATCSSIHRCLLGQTLLLLLLILVESIRGHLGHLLGGHIRVRALNLALEGADLRDNTARKRIGLAHTRRGGRDALRCTTVERRTLHSPLVLESSHHSRVIRSTINIRHVQVRRPLGCKLRVVELLTLLRGVRLLLPRLEKTLLLLQSIGFSNHARVIRGSLHWQAWSCPRCLLHLSLRHHLHGHSIRHLAIGLCTIRHVLHWKRAGLIDTSTRRHAVGHSVRSSTW